jgi:hypothetical protein
MPAPPQPPKVPVKPPSRVPLIVGLAIVVLATIGALILLMRAAD